MLFFVCIFAWALGGSVGVAFALEGSVPWLLNESIRLVSGCRLQGVGGTVLFTPDASSSYGAQWTRDFFFMLDNAPEAFAVIEADVEAAVAYSLSRVTEAGMVPDRVQSDGKAIFAPGVGWPITLAWDNMPFAALLLASATSSSFATPAFFCQWEPVVQQAMRFVATSPLHLAYNTPTAPNSSWGFIDSVTLGGNMLVVSLLQFDAASRLASLSSTLKCGNTSFYLETAQQIRSNIHTLKDPNSPLYLASDHIDALPDIWGSAYLAKLNLSTPQHRKGIADFLATQWTLAKKNTATGVEGEVSSTSSSASSPSSSSASSSASSSTSSPSSSSTSSPLSPSSASSPSSPPSSPPPPPPPTSSPHSSPSVWTQGQLRYLPQPLYWQRCIPGSCPAPGTYQNGAFWATPLTWAVPALAVHGYSAIAREVVNATVASFQSAGINEAINPAIGYVGVKDYVASGTNTYAAAKFLLQYSNSP